MKVQMEGCEEMSKKKNHIKNLTLAAMFLALGLILPFLTGQIPQIGIMLSPMHLPVLLCGLICGWRYGLMVGILTPLIRSAIFGMPVLFPTAIAMAFELGTYGLVIGYLYGSSKWHCLKTLYISLISAMMAGRTVWGIVMFFLLSMSGEMFTWNAFISGALLSTIPGIILQLTLIPAIMVMLDKTGLVPYRKAASTRT